MASSLTDELSAALQAMASGDDTGHKPNNGARIGEPSRTPSRGSRAVTNGEGSRGQASRSRRRPQVQPAPAVQGSVDQVSAPVPAPMQPATQPRNGQMTSSVQPQGRQVAINGRAKPTAARRKTPGKPGGFREVAAPVLFTVGLLLLIPAIWATLLLGGVGVPGAMRSDAPKMAMVMLLCWPVAICLLAASVHFFIQMVKAKKAKLEAMRAELAASKDSEGNGQVNNRPPVRRARR